MLEPPNKYHKDTR